jgi:hypothetical protein
MKFHRICVSLCVVNLLFLAFITVHDRSRADERVSPVLRTRAIELLDDNGKKRAQLNVESNGEVVFRLRDPSGTIRAKFGADERGAGLILMDERTEATVQLRANDKGGNLALFTREGKKLEIK